MNEAKQKSEAVAAAEQLYEAVREHGVPAMSEHFGGLLAEDFDWRPALIGTVEGRASYVGREAFVDYLKDWESTWEEVEMGPARFEEVAPGRVLIPASMRVTGAGSGVPLDIEMAYVFDFEGGQATVGRTFISRRDAEEFVAGA